MKTQFAILLMVLTFSLAAQQEVFTREELTASLQNSKHMWLVYESNSDEHISVFKRVADQFRGFLKAVIVRKSLPDQIVFYEDSREPEVYDGVINADQIGSYLFKKIDKIIEVRSSEARSLKAHEDFVKSEIERINKEWEGEQNLRKKSHTLLLTQQNWSSFIDSRDAFLINFYEANCSQCIELNQDWEQISNELKGEIKVAKINMTDTQNVLLKQILKLAKYPTVRFFKEGPKQIDLYEQFEGIHRKFSILEWVKLKKQAKAEVGDIPHLNALNFENLCKKTKNTCIIVFEDTNNPELLRELKDLAAKHNKKPIAFLISKKDDQKKLAAQMGVTNYPDTVMVYYKLKKIWRMNGTNLKQIEEAIEEISLGNRNNFVKMDFNEEIQ